ncbi:PIN domain-containing protein, partial [Oceanithermus sp.]
LRGAQGRRGGRARGAFAKEKLQLLDLPKEEAILALLLARPSGRVSYADALLWAAAKNHGAERLYTFDERFPADGLEVVQP